MTLNKRPDLTKRLNTVDTGEEDQGSVVGTTAEVIQKIFTTCLTDRSSQRFAKPEGKKVGVYIFANLTLKLLFAVCTVLCPTELAGLIPGDSSKV